MNIKVLKVESASGCNDYIFYEDGKYSNPLFILTEHEAICLKEEIVTQSFKN